MPLETLLGIFLLIQVLTTNLCLVCPFLIYVKEKLYAAEIVLSV